MTAYCPNCDGPLMLLGTLGNLVHLRCRNCGADSHCPADEVDDLDEPDEPEDDD